LLRLFLLASSCVFVSHVGMVALRAGKPCGISNGRTAKENQDWPGLLV
jgi:hypothetical protein